MCVGVWVGGWWACGGVGVCVCTCGTSVMALPPVYAWRDVAGRDEVMEA